MMNTITIKKGIQTAALGLFSSKVGIDGRLAKYFLMSTSDMQNHVWDYDFWIEVIIIFVKLITIKHNPD